MDYTRAVHTIITNELDLDQPIIAGQSLGGAIALTMGLEYGVDLGGLILIGTGARLRVHPNLLEAAVTPRRYGVLDVTMLTTRFLKTEAHIMHIFVIVYPKNNQGAIICQAIQNGHKYAGPKELTTPEEANFLRG